MYLALASVSVLMFVLGTDVPEPYSSLLQWGPLGIFAALLAMGWLVPKSRVDEVVKERDAATEYVRSIETKLRDDVVPLMRDLQHDAAETQKATAAATAATTSAIQMLTDFRGWMTYGRPEPHPGPFPPGAGS